MRRVVAVIAVLAWAATSFGVYMDVGKALGAFETAPLGSIETGWMAHTDPTYGPGVVNDNTYVFHGSQSAMVMPGTNVIYNDVELGTSGAYTFWFYDDMADVGDPDVGKNVRAGLHYDPGPFHAPRLGAVAVESHLEFGEQAYYVHRRFSFYKGNVRRKLGWHEATIEWYDATDPRGAGMTAYIDGTLAYEVNDGVEYSARAEIIASPFGTQSSMWFDAVPEPATMGLLALGGLALVRTRRKR